MPRLCFLNPDWELFGRDHVKAVQSIKPGYWPRRAVGLPGPWSPTSACWVAAEPCGRGCANVLPPPCQGCWEEKKVGKCFWNEVQAEAAFERGKPTAQR